MQVKRNRRWSFAPQGSTPLLPPPLLANSYESVTAPSDTEAYVTLLYGMGDTGDCDPFFVDSTLVCSFMFLVGNSPLSSLLAVSAPILFYSSACANNPYSGLRRLGPTLSAGRGPRGGLPCWLPAMPASARCSGCEISAWRWS